MTQRPSHLKVILSNIKIVVDTIYALSDNVCNMTNEKIDLSFPGACEGLHFHVRGDKVSRGGQRKLDAILASTPKPCWEVRSIIAMACCRETTSGIKLSAGDAKFYLAVLEQIAAGLRPTDIFKSFGLNYRSFKTVLKRDTRLQELYDLAVSTSREAREIMLEDEALRRAVDGIDTPVYHKGKMVDTKKEYSDPLLQTMLKAHAPDRYADRQQIQHGGTVLQLHIEGVRDKVVDPAIEVDADIIDEEDEDNTDG